MPENTPPNAENRSAGAESANVFPFLESLTAFAVMVLLVVASVLAVFNSKAVANMFDMVGKLLGYVREELGLAWETFRAYWPDVRKHFRRYAAVLILTVVLAVILTVTGNNTAAAWCLIIGTAALYFSALVIQVAIGALPLSNAKALGIAIGRPFAVMAVVMSFNAVALLAGPGFLHNLPAATMMTALTLLVFSRSAVFGTRNDKMYHALVSLAVVMVALTLFNHHLLPAYPGAEKWVQARKAWVGNYFKHDTAVSHDSRWRELEVVTGGPLLAVSGERTADLVEAGQIVLADVESAQAITGYPGECYDVTVVVGSQVKAKGFYPLRDLQKPEPPQPAPAAPAPETATTTPAPAPASTPLINRVSATVGNDWVDTGLRPTKADEVIVGPIADGEAIASMEVMMGRDIDGLADPGEFVDEPHGDHIVQLRPRGGAGSYYASIQAYENRGAATLWLRYNGTGTVVVPVKVNRNVLAAAR